MNLTVGGSSLGKWVSPRAMFSEFMHPQVSAGLEEVIIRLGSVAQETLLLIKLVDEI